MGGFKPSRADIAGSTIVGSDKDVDVHQFSGSVFISGSLTLNGSSITGGGGGGGGSPGGSNTQVQFNDGGNFGGSANFTFDGNAITVSDDADVANTFGKVKIGYDGTNSDYAIFAHRDMATNTNFALQQRANGTTVVNAKSDQSLSLRMGNANALVINGATNNNVGINTGSPAARLHVSASSVENDVLRIDGVGTKENALYVSGSGVVGIGTGAPQELLHLQSAGSASIWIEADTDNTPETDTGYLKITQDGGNSKLILGINGNGGTDPEVTYLANGMSNAGLVGTRTSGMPMQFTTGNRSKICIQPDGQVGIGEGFDESTRPTALLHVSGGSTAQGTARTSPLMLLEHDDSANILFVTGSGLVGIGTNTPIQTLSVSGSTAISGTYGSTAVETVSTSLSTLTATDGVAIIDLTAGATNTSFAFFIANGTYIGQEKIVYVKTIVGADGANSNDAALQGSNIDSPLGNVNGTLSLSASDQGEGFFGMSRGAARLLWDGTDWAPISVTNLNWS